jgi:hypothetical protein
MSHRGEALPDTASLAAGIALLRDVIGARLSIHFQQASRAEVKGAACFDDGTAFSRFVEQHRPSFDEYVVLMLALAPHVQPNLLHAMLEPHLAADATFPLFGAARGSVHRGLLPTGETAQFILAGDDLARRLQVQRLFSGGHWFGTRHVLWLAPVAEGEPAMSGRLVLAPDVVELLTIGKAGPPRFSMEFPAEPLGTAMAWEDLVLAPDTLRQLDELDTWLTHRDALLADWGMGRKVKPGYRALFHGPPGTGKSLTAALLGKRCGREVLRIDLSRVVSKYIGETEKNLARLFDKAETRGWILFFDEADALFGKRTDIRDAHDRYANQEVAYLLQRIEAYDGVVILATNQRGNIDDAFIRRFQSIVHFPMPGPTEREALWRGSFPPHIAQAADIDWAGLARRHELSGAAILNASCHAALQVLAGGGSLAQDRLEAAILREHLKEGRVV